MVYIVYLEVPVVGAVELYCECELISKGGGLFHLRCSAGSVRCMSQKELLISLKDWHHKATSVTVWCFCCEWMRMSQCLGSDRCRGANGDRVRKS